MLLSLSRNIAHLETLVNTIIEMNGKSPVDTGLVSSTIVGSHNRLGFSVSDVLHHDLLGHSTANHQPCITDTYYKRPTA